MGAIEQKVEEIITEISMSVNHNNWLIVEGTSDEKFFRIHQLSNKPIVIVAFGWENVERIVEESQDLNKKIIVGLVDRDYRYLEDENNLFGNIVITDYRDIENILFESRALDKVFFEFGSKGKLPKNDNGELDLGNIKNHLSGVTFELGVFRAYCYVNNLNVSFEKLRYSDFIDVNTVEFKHTSFLKHLQNKPKNYGLPLVNYWKDAQVWVNEIDLVTHEYIRHGHDLMEIIAISLKKFYGSHNNKSIPSEMVEAFFRISIEKSELVNFKFWNTLEQFFKN